MNKMLNNTIKKLLLICTLLSGTASASSAIVNVPGNASGGFGLPPTGYIGFIPALHVNGKGTVVISYQSGTVTDDGGINTGPEGSTWTLTSSQQVPLQEAIGTKAGTIPNLDSLIGAFVPASIVSEPGFAPVDGSKGISLIGIQPSQLFFIGKYTTVEVNGPGTIYLGINDSYVSDNHGSFTVKVTGP